MEDRWLHSDDVEPVDLNEIDGIRPHDEVYSAVPTRELKRMVNEIRFWRAKWERRNGAN